MTGDSPFDLDNRALIVLVTVAVITAPIAIGAVAGQTIRIRPVSGNQVDVTISNAGGDSFTIEGEGMQNYNPSEKNAGANVEAIRLRLNQGGSYEMALHYRPGTDPSTPEIAGVQPLTKINASHPSLPNSNIDEATIRFGVKKSRLDELNVGPDDVVFYRLDGDTWEEHNVAQVSEEFDEYRFETQLSALSWLAIGVKQPNFEILNPYLGVDEIGEGGQATVFVKVFNDGTTTGTLPVTVTTDGSVLARRNVTLSPDESQNLEIPVSFETLGEYAINVNNKRAGTLRVVPAGEADPEPTDEATSADGDAANDTGGEDDDTGSDDGGNGMPGFTVVAAVLAAAAAVGFRRR